MSSSADHVVAIGASAGGVSALQVLIGALPRDLPAGVLVVLHLEPTRASHLPELLARVAAIEVHAAVDGEPILPGHVYTAIANAHLLANGGNVELGRAAPVHFSRPSIDLLFESVATSFGAGAIGVVLTGSGSDGTVGLQAIKRRGGTTIVQDTSEAEHSSMPASAHATGCVDLMLPLRDIAPALVRVLTDDRAPR